MAEWIKELWEMEYSGPAESSWRVCCTLGGGKAEGWDVGASGEEHQEGIKRIHRASVLGGKEAVKHLVK